METKEQILHLLLQKGFKFRFYEDQNLLFYTKEITEPVFVKWFAEEHCHLTDCDLTHVSISLEITDNLERAQYTFFNGIDKQYIFKDLLEFREVLEKLPNLIELR
ncbi:hypothetical protein FCT18_04770 [Lysinibacillus sphaericus]|uniref:Uncharacterized protein n=1 Tax=Lysinibacillus sphaericus TaxID=1421 RepID=A0A2S0K0Z9_LYSSH|nr:hypothetical protein [Lysinibacillus sphaericus]AVK96924.1 hypothetical protein LS41612_11955 [Lysinibacillus sphaericus]MED4542198.1 hypothetical protein [Lysinibacillus sphaericus]TKI20511.1 hypothetical protein FCT18_04770 [Lysinibacillus sphaericus]SUV17234.1 Uncharacterised protein [Lysinibacillus sphaericus]GEC81800.1 hypothetical protein LSP03_15430 [Lysinibacillus sphaericus]